MDDLRTLIINGITGAVAMGLAANVLTNREIEPRRWSGAAPFVEIIVPARNEAGNIRPLLATLLRQEYPKGRYRVTVVDDGSTDGTAALARKVARRHSNLRVIEAPPLPTGWTGKNHALWSGAQNADAGADWLLFVDADTRHHPLMLASVVQHALQVRADLLSLVIDVRMESFWERVLVPQVGEIYTMLVGSMDAVNRKGGSAAANGQFILVRPQLYRQVGGSEAVRSDVAEDRALAAAARAAGATIKLLYGRRLIACRPYDSLPQMWRGYSKTLFWASGRDTPKTLLVALCLGFYASTPLVSLARALASGRGSMRARLLRHAALQLAPMMLLRVAVCRLMRISSWYAPVYPLSVAAGNAMLLYSLFRVLSGRGVEWKERTYHGGRTTAEV
jgi:chlorobactene glucosyltransferase